MYNYTLHNIVQGVHKNMGFEETDLKSYLLRVSVVLSNLDGQNKVTSARVYFM